MRYTAALVRELRDPDARSPAPAGTHTGRRRARVMVYGGRRVRLPCVAALGAEAYFQHSIRTVYPFAFAAMSAVGSVLFDFAVL